jgi:N-methylhydantoinase A/oxoprolinase/acetone carboxylase beta subunit
VRRLRRTNRPQGQPGPLGATHLEPQPQASGASELDQDQNSGRQCAKRGLHFLAHFSLVTESSGRLLGVDTGGTYTDAVIYDEATAVVVAKAKAPTTHDDLSIGIGGAINAVLDTADVSAKDIDLVSLSTTLATNALVENKGRPACLVSIGFDAAALERAGLADNVGRDRLIFLAGGHTSHGIEAEPLDLDELRTRITAIADDVDAVAVTAQFSVRNAAHELAAYEVIREATGLPVTLSHGLSARLNGPKRAVTALLNARLIPMIADLVSTAEQTLRARGVTAPLMVVRGNGSLVSADFVRDRPIETILSGPAASLIGAAHLTELADAVIADIGGTTTDIAVLRGGQPEFSDEGAHVGGHQTMVAAVRMHTHGLGGDSEVAPAHVDRGRLGESLQVGPRRVIPLCLFADAEREMVLRELAKQLEVPIPSELHGRFVLPVRHGRSVQLDRVETELVQAVADGPRPATEVVTTSVKRMALDRLVGRGLLRVAGFTPTDASHVLGTQSHHDPSASELGARILARQRDRFGQPIAPDATTLSEMVVAEVVRLSADMMLAATLAHDGLDPGDATSDLVKAALGGHAGTTSIRVNLSVPLVGLGGPAATYYPAVARRLGTDIVVPANADVANAIGAVVGRVRLCHEVTVSAPRRGLFRVHVGDEPPTFYDLDEARRFATEYVTTMLANDMRAAGAGSDHELIFDWVERSAEIENRPLFVEGTLTGTASGRPDLR